jgi:fucose permease
VRFHILLFFLYTGLELSIGQWSFTVLTESRGVTPDRAGIWVGIYWGSILGGRILFGFVVDRLRIDTLIRLSLAVALAGTALFAWNPFPRSAPVALALAGIGLAVVFPCLMTRTPQRLGKEIAAHAIGFQVGAAMLGAAALPSLAGFIAQFAGLRPVGGALLVVAATLFLLHEIVVFTTATHAERKGSFTRDAQTLEE